MLEYNPVPNHRIVWYGGDSNMLHFEVFVTIQTIYFGLLVGVMTNGAVDIA
jgi:hypothetical protein